MNTIYLILVSLGFIAFDRLVRYKPQDEIAPNDGEAKPRNVWLSKRNGKDVPPKSS